MVELVTLQYGSFTRLGEWVKEYAQRTSWSKWVADQTLQCQLYLDENTWAGVLPKNKSGVSLYWNAHSTMQPP